MTLNGGQKNLNVLEGKIAKTCQPASETIVARFFTMKARAADFSLQSVNIMTRRQNRYVTNCELS